MAGVQEFRRCPITAGFGPSMNTDAKKEAQRRGAGKSIR